jgi:hypothetical protein
MHSLAHLSDDELVAALTTCCVDMRRFKVHVLLFLAEVEARQIHLLAAASSLWAYARDHLQMSHGTAFRFIKVARLCKKFPFLLERIERGELHLTTLTQIAPFITNDNVHDLVEETRGKNRTRVELVLRKWFGVEPTHGRMGSPMPYDEELLNLVERARELLSHAIPSGNTLEITKAAFHILIAHLEKKKRAKTANPHPAPTKPTKQISQHATRVMFERHGDQCSYVDERTGARCTSRSFIQRDHIDMQAHGGTHDPDNLQPMCAPHNLLRAQLALGRAYVERRIRCRQQQQTDTKEPTED